MKPLLPLKRGDHVVCVDNSWPHANLEVGAEYIVESAYSPDGVWIEGHASMLPVNVNRFQLVVSEELDAISEMNKAVSFEYAGASPFPPDVSRKVATDNIVLPPHYARFKIEPVRFAIENNLNGFQFNILKYMMRWDAKNGLEDLRKALRYLEMFIKYVEGDADWWRAPKEAA